MKDKYDKIIWIICIFLIIPVIAISFVDLAITTNSESSWFSANMLLILFIIDSSVSMLYYFINRKRYSNKDALLILLKKDLLVLKLYIVLPILAFLYKLTNYIF